MGCKYEVDTQDDITWIQFKYKGKTFLIDCRAGSKFATAYYPGWYSLSTNGGMEDVVNLQKTINMANHYGCCTLFYEVIEESEKIVVYSKSIMVFIPEIPKIDIYLEGVLDDFFKVQEYVMTELEKCKTSQS